MARELAAVENIEKGDAMEKLAESLAKKKVAA
ncbi:MAG TPA: CarD family transcriptional regulator, partial [Hyphomonas sp.]|nr:CarD family transcriptional regulator [Hyphomonas sp.]HCN91677.1 CarD family transcriptional regulator [Hyphomonas sp.]